MEENTQPFVGKEIIACLSCLAPNDAAADFCEKCGAPLSATSTLDPLKMIRAEGFIIQKATQHRPKFIVLLGIWVLFLPALLGSIPLILSQFFYGAGFAGFVFFWIGVGLAVFSFYVLYRVTKNYSTAPEPGRNPEERETS